MQNKTDIFVSFLGNPFNDSRVINLYNSLKDKNLSCRIIGFNWESDYNYPSKENIEIIKLNKTSSLKFYFSFLISHYKSLKNSDAKIYFAEDIYTLPLSIFAARSKKAKVYYNSRELYSFIGGLRHRKFIQKIISLIERWFIHSANLVLTTGEMDSEFLLQRYGIQNSLVIRNIPLYKKEENPISIRDRFKIDHSKKILLYQGVLHEGRGIEKIIKLLPKFENLHFIIIGEGPFRKKFEKTAEENNVKDKVTFSGRVSHEELMKLTPTADIGLALIENISLSYYYALPNKLFEYIMAEVPVLSSNLPQMERIVNQYKVGLVVEPENDFEIESALNRLLASNLSIFKNNCKTASEELNWQKEFEKLFSRMKRDLNAEE